MKVDIAVPTNISRLNVYNAVDNISACGKNIYVILCKFMRI